MTFSNQVENILQSYFDGNFDLLFQGLTVEQHGYARQYLSDEYFSVPKLSTIYLGFDTRFVPFDDPRVRRAIVLATDRDTLISKIFRGVISPANGGLLPPGMPGYAPDIALPYDPDRARFLLAEAGFPAGNRFPVKEGIFPSVSNSNASPSFLLVKLLQDQWLKNLGIHVNWTRVSWEGIAQLSPSKKPSLRLGAWVADYHDPHSFFADAGWNRLIDQENLWNQPEFNRLIQKAKGFLKQEERINLYRQADRIIVEEAPLIPLYYGATQGYQKPWVKGLTFPPLSNYYFKDVIIEVH